MSRTVTESPRRELSARQLETVDRLAEATREELRETGYDGLTVRSVADRASVASATAYTYFSSKNHLVAETFWRRLVGRPAVGVPSGTPTERVVATVRDMAAFLSEEPELAAAATPALLGPHPDVQELRERIGTVFIDWVREALGEGADREVVRTLGMTFSGAMLEAGMGFMTYEEMGERLVTAARLIMGRR